MILLGAGLSRARSAFGTASLAQLWLHCGSSALSVVNELPIPMMARRKRLVIMLVVASTIWLDATLKAFPVHPGVNTLTAVLPFLAFPMAAVVIYVEVTRGWLDRILDPYLSVAWEDVAGAPLQI